MSWGNLILVLMSFLGLVSPPDERIKWSEERRLKWSDFKAEANYEVPWAATTSSGMTHEFSGNIKGDEVTYDSKVKCFFYPQNSWYKKELATDNLLLHEQLHFDIAELHARKLRKRIAYKTFTKNLRKEMQALYELTNGEMKRMQQAYDEATNYSLNKEVQLKWKAQIAGELKRLEKYSQ